MLNNELRDSNDNLLVKIDELKQYKVSYHTLKDTFDLPPDKRPRRGFRRPVISTKKVDLSSTNLQLLNHAGYYYYFFALFH